MSTVAKPTWLYRFIFTALSPLIAWHSIAQARQLNDSRMARQKLGKDFPKRDDRPLWVHMASVGEVNAAYPLLMEIRDQYPDLPLMVSTFTPTGAENAIKKLGPGIQHVFLPLDFNKAVATFFHQLNPRCALIMETEIWPRLFYHCKLNKIPLLIINGRLSARTLNRPAWIRAIYRQALQNVDQVFARSQTDAEHFNELGITKEKVKVIGNIKFAVTAQQPITPITLPRPYVVAASTHDDEELQLSRAWLNSGLNQSHLLVIVPRHPKRKAAIMKQLQSLTSELAVRSNNEEATSETQIHLADTFGELKQFIAGAELTFIGGSLIPHGGQNVLEVAQLGKPVFFGPHMENFIDEKELLLKQQAAIEVSDAKDLIKKIKHYLEQPETLARIGQHAKEAVTINEDIAERYLDALRPYLSADS